ncbi:hypothetical protein GIB67_031504 [Kingdonia uniflora]|uniref:Jacalin-type lectin domain-containing protein n=1 Tax=Kingdonia uniflora TaxID=39325 RepID=A0A7J7MNA7_9MAGN|nr:hypothetical protein GIB67_031504 [Kingdonia uniflora]
MSSRIDESNRCLEVNPEVKIPVWIVRKSGGLSEFSGLKLQTEWRLSSQNKAIFCLKKWRELASPMILIRHTSNVIYSLKFGSVKDNGEADISDEFGCSNKSHGDYAKSHLDKVQINWPNEYLTSLRWSKGYAWMDFRRGAPIVLTSLKVITNVTTYGPFGSRNDSRETISVEGRFIVDFYGGMGWFIDSIGVYLKPTSSRPSENENIQFC